MITLSFPDLVALGVLFLTLFVLLDRRALLREMKRTRREVKALREALTMQGKPTKRGYIPPVLRQKVIERCEYTCQYCSGIGDEANGPDGLPWHVDHVVPVVKGGPTHDGNLTLSCSACNQAKGTLNAVEFMVLDEANGESGVKDADMISKTVKILPQNLQPSEEDKQHISERFDSLQSLKAVERELYGQEGGIKFYWVRDAVNEMRLRRGQATI